MRGLVPPRADWLIVTILTASTAAVHGSFVNELVQGKHKNGPIKRWTLAVIVVVMWFVVMSGDFVTSLLVASSISLAQ